MSQGFQIKPADANKNSHAQTKKKDVPEMRDIQRSLLKHFGELKDPRIERTKKHQLTDIKRDCNFSNNCGGARLGRYGKLWYQ